MNAGKQPYSGDAPGTSLYRPVIATVMLVALLSLFFSAGFWQLGRADEKTAILERYASASSDGLITALVPDDAADALRFRNLRLTGRYQPERQILLDNMTDGGSNGYQVLTPFVTASGTVLVNRGWVRADPDRSVLPDIGVGDEPRTITGRINDFPAPGLRLGQPAEADSAWPRRLLFPTAADLAAALAVELPAYQLQLAATETDGYLREWKVVDSGPEKHLGYAFQWFSFAALACLFYVLLMVQWFRARRAADKQ